ncbi:hypothetical protein OS493_016475 [Desmophyllum pertusum]|uniref:Uncharacterized protein n=1 Tax=Desmophyllum pertusum TaxID=174260 RepID=A0A9X0D4H6_9CNID|nr:hypothetical protein OS493_016475 [Desmophyllum pertusum]
MLPLNKSSSSDEGLPSKFKARLLDCFGYTTAHGYGRVAAAESRPRRWFWLLACAAAFGVFTYQLHDLTLQFLSKPLKTRTQIQHERKLPFPQVTICNLNKIRQSRIPEKIKKDFPEIISGVGSTGSNSSAPSPTRRHNNKPAVVNFDDLPADIKLVEMVHQKLAEYSDDVLQVAGHQLKDLILSCTYNSYGCLYATPNLWTQFWHHKYGNCFTYNRGKDDHDRKTEVMTSSIPGHEGGLTLELNIEQSEYISQLSQEAGVQVFVSTQNEMPFPYELGISAAPGYSTAIQLRKVKIGRLDPFANQSCEPRDNLVDNNIFRRFNVSYSDLTCKISCLATLMNIKCGCVLYTLKYSKMDVCDMTDEPTADCVDATYDKYYDGVCESNCREKCREDSFKMTVSVSKWPSRHYKSTLQKELEEQKLGNYSSDLGENFLKLKVYYGELNYEVLEEERAYAFSRFLSDIGGIMGMWIGISALTCVEVLELIASLCYAILRRIKGQGVNVIEVQSNENPA